MMSLKRISRQRKFSLCFIGMRANHKDRNEVFLEGLLINKEPIRQFQSWFEEACSNKEICQPSAMCLATATKEGIPSARFVILKEYGKDGFTFFTDYGSRKAKEIEENPNVAASFYWELLNRSVRIEGQIEKVSEEESDRVFQSRPLKSQVAAKASHQSSPIESNDVIAEKMKEIEMEYVIPGKKIPKPAHWGGYVIRPTAVEFWQGQEDRLSDRIRYKRKNCEETPDGKTLHQGEDGWVFERLSP